MKKSLEWPTIDKIHSETKRAGEIVTACLIIGAVVSTSLGFAVVSIYLSIYEIPFMLFDTSFSFAIQVFGIQFFYWTAVFSIYCFIPIFVPFILSASPNNAVPHLSTIHPLDEERERSDFSSFFVEYMVFFLPVYSITLTVLGLYLFGADVAIQHFAFNACFAGSFMVGLSSLALMGYIRKSKQIDLLVSFLWINMLSVLWVLLFGSRIAGFIFPDNAVPTYSRQEIFISIIITCIPLLAHFLLTWLRRGARMIVVIPILLMCVVELAVGFPAFGGFVLREAGAGGGTPIDFIAPQTGSDPQHGCLVLATSLYLYIEPAEAGKPCAMLARMGFAGSKQPSRHVNIFVRDQVSFPVVRLTPSS